MSHHASKRLSLDLSKSNLICGDCKDWLAYIPNESVDLVCIDPPFFSNKNYEIIWGNGFELRSFGDRWKGGINHYIEWIKPSIIEAHRVLKPTGSIFLHCDKHASHHLRIMLDRIFKEKNFVNEIIWYYKGGLKNTHKMLPQKHDNIYFYAKSSDYFFNLLRKENEDDKKKVSLWQRWGKYSSDGENIRLSEIPETDKINRQRQINKFKRQYKREPEANDILYTLEYPLLEDVWDDCSPVYRLKEKIGYDTQKPESLLNRIIKSASQKGDLVLDCFGGGGTTAKVAADLGRRFITGDISPVAYQVIKDRLEAAGHKDFVDCNPPLTRDEWRGVNGHDFADRICSYMGWESNQTKSGDGGIDGWANGRKSAIQIKNSSVQPSAVRDFAAACQLEKYKHGIIVGWAFSKGCYEFRAKLARESGIKIELKLAETIVKPVSKTDRENWQKLYNERVKNKFFSKGKASDRKPLPLAAAAIAEAKDDKLNIIKGLKRANKKTGGAGKEAGLKIYMPGKEQAAASKPAAPAQAPPAKARKRDRKSAAAEPPQT